MAIFGLLSTVRSQTARLSWLEPAYTYLDQVFTPGSEAQEKLKSLGAGETFRRELSGGAFALEQVYLTKPRSEGCFETHRKYVDVQVILEGEEVMVVTHPGRLVIRDHYNPERDAIFYHDAGSGSVLQFGPGDTAIYFPEDAHSSALQVSGPQLVRKTVIKVPVP